ncbi:hypothetical protein [Aureimonas sp. AU20]|uniref:hypothetical protein n=1 Tax=Aureimonas sp. AU20 TaxID=1349819 RepID=UPI000722D28F|nr:hypothetical protein [Aureimonas sp. AU20]ALN75292.1 hypothetical protein M673_21390 [Aureimonas sp. AU20]
MFSPSDRETVPAPAWPPPRLIGDVPTLLDLTFPLFRFSSALAAAQARGFIKET